MNFFAQACTLLLPHHFLIPLSFFQLEEELSGVVEVIGMVSNKGAIMANTYNLLREDKGIPFGRSSYITGLYIQINTAAFMCNS